MKWKITLVACKAAVGTVFRDDDQSNLQNGAEPGIGLITVSLYRDNGAPTDVTDDTLVTTVETAANGTYTFANLDPASHRVNVDTTDPDLPASALIGTSHPRTGVVVTAGNTTTTDFGFDIFTCTPGGGGATDAAISPYISKEVSGTGVASRNEADTLDDAWRSAARVADLRQNGNLVRNHRPQSGSLRTGVIFHLRGGSGCYPCQYPACLSLPWQCAHVRGFPEHCCQHAGCFPRPASLYNASTQPAFWTDTGGDNQTPNAVRFTLATPVKSFGAWFSDINAYRWLCPPGLAALTG